MSRAQNPEETIDEYVHALHQLARHCKFRNVNAATYKDELKRDAFINEINSGAIRQRLLENNNFDLTEAVKKAQMLDRAQKQFGSYLAKTLHVAVATAEKKYERAAVSESKSRFS